MFELDILVLLLEISSLPPHSLKLDLQPMLNSGSEIRDSPFRREPSIFLKPSRPLPLIEHLQLLLEILNFLDSGGGIGVVLVGTGSEVGLGFVLFEVLFEAAILAHEGDDLGPQLVVGGG
jgi:hypothetical protein